MGQLNTCQAAKGESTEQFLSPTTIYNNEEANNAKIVSLCFASAEGNLDRIKKMLQKGVDVNSVDYDKRSPLHLAAANGRLEVVQYLLTVGADVHAVDRWGHTVLDEATSGGHQDVMSALRVAGADLGRTPRRHNTSTTVEDGVKLCSIAAQGDVEAMQALQAKGIRLDEVDYDGRSALHIAAAHGHLELVKWLVNNHAKVNLRDNFGLTGLAEATRNGHEAVAKVLRDAGADAADLESLKLSSDMEHWSIPSCEVQLGPILNKTLKSKIYHATWRGTKVVAKTSGELLRSQSGCSLVSLAQSEGSDDSDEALKAQEVLHEIHLLSTMRHPDLVMFLGACLDSNPPFFITEFMEGGDLERYYCNKSKQLGHPFRPQWDLFLKWARAVARALSFLHSCARPVIHRDLKPLNLLLTSTLDLKVTDFGISKLVRPHAMEEAGTDRAEMSGGVGTWRYMAPEVVRYQQYTDRVDIYSFSLIMWFMSTGLQPFVAEFGNNAEIVLKEYLKGKEPRPDVTYAGGRCGPTLPAPLHEFIKDCWHVTPASRPSAYDCTQRLATMHIAEGRLQALTSLFR